jgi:hypothetical protein
MMEHTSKLYCKIVAWIDVQHKFFPALANSKDEAHACIGETQPILGVMVSSIKLWLLLHVVSAPAADTA